MIIKLVGIVEFIKVFHCSSSCGARNVGEWLNEDIQLSRNIRVIRIKFDNLGLDSFPWLRRPTTVLDKRTLDNHLQFTMDKNPRVPDTTGFLSSETQRLQELLEVEPLRLGFDCQDFGNLVNITKRGGFSGGHV